MPAVTKNPDQRQQQQLLIRKKDELTAVAFKFTRFLIQSNFIVPEKRKLSKAELLLHYSSFQANIPSHVKASEIVKALSDSHLLAKKRNSAVPTDEIEFKKLVFADNSTGPAVIDDEKLQQPKIRVFINESRVFQNNNGRALAVVGQECRMCKKVFANDVELNDHTNSDIHKFRELYRTARRQFKVAVEGLSISDVTRMLDKDERDESVVKISNTSKATFEIIQDIPLVDLDEVQVHVPDEKIIKPGANYEYKLVACFPRRGAYEYPVVFMIKEVSNNSVHNLLSTVTYKVLNKEVHELYTGVPYEPDVKKYVVFAEAPVVCGIPLQSARLSYKIPLKPYTIPTYLNKFLRVGFKSTPSLTPEEDALLQKIKKILVPDSANGGGTEVFNIENVWTTSNYVQRFEFLLYMEEYQQRRAMLSYNRQDVILTAKSVGRFDLEVPGLAEGRPSILKGDSVFVLHADKKHKFEGIVHDVRENTASLAFNKAFQYTKNQKVGVEFQLNRTTLRIAQRALELVSKEGLQSFMFPVLCNTSPPTYTGNTRYYNRQIEGNCGQKLAVNNIVRNTAYPAPYIVYGPPGTGKTSTVVEAITQLFFNGEKTLKICACAPSNAAANLLATKLIQHIPPSQMYRLFSISHSARQVPEELQRCSNFAGIDKDLSFPNRELVKSKKILIITPITAGRLYGVLGESYFDYLFFDEAGQAEEPLTLVPLTGLLKREKGRVSGSLVLTGDPKQLGPIIHSRLASYLGLGTSMIERLMETCEPYKKKDGVYNANHVTKLTYNYRSHPAFLDVPNQLFYDNELESHADQNTANWLSSWELLPKKNVPLIFHGVKGKDDRESNSPSYFNLDEIARVCDYLTDLVGAKIKGREVRPEDIVVLTPYRKQVQKFRTFFQKKKWEKIEVASIEQFQGQEKCVVILSCVRSRKEFLPSDYQFGLGFLRNPKRFNVAITRAKSLMIIVGNPDVLQCDPCWRVLLKHCKDIGCYRGAEPDGCVDDIDPSKTLALDLSALIINDVPDSEKPSFPKEE